MHLPTGDFGLCDDFRHERRVEKKMANKSYRQ
jgi:hypothetical protein